MALALVCLGFVFFFFGISIYGRWLEKLFGVEPSRPTPAVSSSDGVDKVPAPWPILFGHHFASIAGAAPIIGPVLAISLWGWVPVYWWVVLGSVFVGGLHDFGALMMSLRYGGMSIAGISKEVLSDRAKVFFSIFLYLALVLVVAVFSAVTAKTFIEGPEIVLPSFGLIGVAVFLGYLFNNRRWKIVPGTVLGLFLLALLIALGGKMPITITGEHALPIWITILLIYAFVASITPVQYLLQPRDYLSSYLLFFGLILGYAGLLVSRPSINFPQHSMDSPLEFWPMLFVVVACGALSGFHSLIASGTTARQIANESHGRKVAYAAMVAEGALALLSTMAIIAGYSSPERFLATLKEVGPIGAFSQGFGVITTPVLGKWGSVFAVIMLNSFVFTTLDTATRVGRYVVEDLTGIKNRQMSSLFVVVPALILAISGQWKSVWPLFGAANQLIASMVLLMIWLFLMNNNKRSGVVLLMGGAMYITIMAALCKKLVQVFPNNLLLSTIAVILLILAVYMIFEVGKKGLLDKKGGR